MGSPPQIETIGAPHSSDRAPGTARPSSISLIVDLYSRMRPQPVQVRLQACSGSSIMTIGNFLRAAKCACVATYFARFAVIFSGYLIQLSSAPLRGRICWPPASGYLRNARKSPRFCSMIAIPRQRVQRKIISVQMILQIKHAGKSGSRKFLFIPRAVGVLLFHQMRNRAADRPDLHGRQQPANQSIPTPSATACSTPWPFSVGS